MTEWEHLLVPIPTNEPGAFTRWADGMGARGWDAAPPDWETCTVWLKRPRGSGPPGVLPFHSSQPRSVRAHRPSGCAPLIIVPSAVAVLAALLGVLTR